MSYAIKQIEGIGSAMAEKLETVGITKVEQLLEKGATKAGRAALASETGIDESKILRWVNMADLFRVKGIAEENSDLLEAAGVDTVKELRTRNAENLHAKLAEVNAEKNLVRALPSLSAVESWIEFSKGLEPMVSH
jgi:predicted flap endonuclease-1-like 5' DNA nuclease